MIFTNNTTIQTVRFSYFRLNVPKVATVRALPMPSSRHAAGMASRTGYEILTRASRSGFIGHESYAGAQVLPWSTTSIMERTVKQTLQSLSDPVNDAIL